MYMSEQRGSFPKPGEATKVSSRIAEDLGVDPSQVEVRINNNTGDFYINVPDNAVADKPFMEEAKTEKGNVLKRIGGLITGNRND